MGNKFSCNNDGIGLSNNADLKNLLKCSRFAGSVYIKWKGDLNLGSLDSIGGSLTFDGDYGTTSITAQSLESIGGRLELSGAKSLKSLTFPSLKRVDDSLELSYLPQYDLGNSDSSLLGAPNLVTVGSGFVLSNLTSLTTLSMANLQTVGGDFSVSWITQATSLSASSLTSIGGSCSLSDSRLLKSVALPHLQSISEGFTLRSLTSLTTLSVAELQTIGGDFSFFDITRAASLSADLLTSIGGGCSLSNSGLLEQVVLPRLQNISGGFELRNLTKLTAFEGNFSDVGGSIVIENNKMLRNISMSKLAKLGGNLSYTGDGGRVEAELLKTISGTCSFTSSQSLRSIDLPNLKSIAGGFRLTDLNRLVELNQSVVNVGGDLSIHDIRMTQLSLLNLTTIGGSLDIQGPFTSISFPSLMSVSQGSHVDLSGGNVSLCQYINDLKVDGVFLNGVSCTPRHGFQSLDIVGLVLGTVTAIVFLMLPLCWSPGSQEDTNDISFRASVDSSPPATITTEIRNESWYEPHPRTPDPPRYSSLGRYEIGIS